MARFDQRFLTVTVTIGLLVAALGLSACGRKGALEAPPSISATGKPAPPASQPTPDRPFILDPLL